MEQAQYWMLTRRRQFLKSHFQVSMNNSLSEISWEEKAFAEDAAVSLGGCIWPPRSYSCSFCRREFRSAQALGGHMNVHRRDRARLKQSLSPNDEVVSDHQTHNPNPLKSSDPIKAASTLASADNFDRNSTTTFSASRVSALPSHENCGTSSIVQGQHKGKLFGSDSSAKRTLDNVVSGFGNDQVETDLSVGLNSVFFQNRPTYVTCGKDAINYKRRKMAVSTQPFLVSKEKYFSLQLQVLGLKPAAGSMEDLDLELRLGVQ